MRKKKVLKLAKLNENSKIFKTREKVGEKPISIRRQRKILKMSKYYNQEKKQEA